ncbi:hypothetical protein [Humisphaera borealis]|uniref:Uncharacterized protein n=1 Tax=Humisphaera borealis TaxID=2807512 RepID=A0A7M2WU02_9BACT|nr:hypothetical protein [Humisphaera borealis]QOV88281.1 hypothetical protein IPV69_18770 [Humisphaera borealis]
MVLTTVSHLNNFVFNLTPQNAAGQTDTRGVTGYHKFYDQAEGWRSASDLAVGYMLRGRTLEIPAIHRPAPNNCRQGRRYCPLNVTSGT